VYLLSWCPELGGGREAEWRLSGNKKWNPNILSFSAGIAFLDLPSYGCFKRFLFVPLPSFAYLFFI
jgi:hypothetical protein